MTLARKPAEPGGFSTFKRRKPKPSKRASNPVTPGTHALVMARSKGRCEAPPELHPQAGCSGRMHVHHRLPVSWGGGPEVTNLLYLCDWVHAWAHNHPVAAITWGLIVPRRSLGRGAPGGDPARYYPVTVSDDRRVFLTDDGGYQEVA